MHTARVVVLANSVSAGGIHFPNAPGPRPLAGTAAGRILLHDVSVATSHIEISKTVPAAPRARHDSRGPFRLSAVAGAATMRETTR